VRKSHTGQSAEKCCQTLIVFLRSCDANTASTEMMESCMSEYCVGGIATVGTNTYFSGCSVARCATDSHITTTTIPVGSDVDDSCWQQANRGEDCDESDSDETAIGYVSYSSSQDVFPDETELRSELVKWYARFGVSLDALGALLQILHAYHPVLPVDARTLLKTPSARNLNVKKIPEGHYCHFGVANGIQNLFQQGYINPYQDPKEILLQINIDGLPLFKSTNYQLWPILGMVIGLRVKRPFVIGLYGGNRKPSDVAQYLEDFVKESQCLEVNGINLGSSVWVFKIHSIMCDAPACSFVRNTKGHNAYGGCDRCRQTGLWLKRVVFLSTSADNRTDLGFRNKIDEDYHIGDSPILPLSIDIVQQLPLDYMHLVCLGVVRRLLMAWLKGSLTCRLPSKSVLQISDRLLSMRQFVSSEFCRRPRPLSEIDRYKATEFRQILLYTGLVAFRGIVADEVYLHFLLLSVAVRCLVSPRLSQSHADYASQLLVMFVHYASQLCGQEFLVYNVHCLVHLSDDVKRFGPLDNFPYENFLKQIKKMVRSSHLPFQQVISRLVEFNGISEKVDVKPVCQNEHSMGPVVNTYEPCIQYSSVRTQQFSLNLSDRDSCVIVDDGRVGVVKNVLLCFVFFEP